MKTKKYNYKNIHPNKKSIFLFGLALFPIVLTIGYLGYNKASNDFQNDQQAQTTQSNETEEPINFSPPNDEEKSRGDEKKQDIVNEQTQQNDDQSGKKDVKPVITSAGQFGDQIEVRGFIPGIYENTGSCTITLMQNDVTIVRQVEGLQDATTTRCDTVNILRSDMPSAGTWKVNIEYNSPTSQGVSDETTFEVN